MADNRSFDQWRPHPWHGLSAGDDPPKLLQAYIEITPFDFAKYEIDKESGYLRVDRPQQTSSLPPTLYGFVPRTYCGDRVAALTPGASRGDGDPLDICVFSEYAINRAEVLLNARVVGGLTTQDGGSADDKIIAVLDEDNVWGRVSDVSEFPQALVDRLKHYFATYKQDRSGKSQVVIHDVYSREKAYQVVKAALEDYEAAFASR